MSELIESGINNLGDFIEDSLAMYADKPAFSCQGQTLSYQDIEIKSRALACWLQQETNLQPGDRVVIQLPNIIQYPIAAYAALRAGLVVVNTNPMYTPKEMRHQFKDSGAKAIITLQDLLPKLNEVIADTKIDHVIMCSMEDLSQETKAYVEGIGKFITLNQALQQGESQTLKPRKNINLDDTCVLQYTGGTTGVSKGAELTHRNLISNARQTMGVFDGQLGEQEIFVCPLPLYHIYAFAVNMMSLFSRGVHNVLIPNPRDMTAFINDIKPFKFSGFSGINTLFVGLCTVPEFKELDFSNFKYTLSGGSTLTTDAVTAWKKVTGCSISEGYGLSETASVVCLNQPGKEWVGTVGKPVLQTDIQIWDDQDQPVAIGMEGQIVLKGPQVMKGYWNMPEETQQAIINGYFKTGDVGKILDDGFVKIVDRLKDMIIVSGFNVYPNEVEEVLTRHPAILEAAVVGQDDAKTGESVCAYITVNTDLAIEDVIRHCREELTNYKVPKQVVFMDELPKSTVGKILRRELRQ